MTDTGAPVPTPDGRHPVFALSDSLVEELARRSPMLSTYLGIPGRNGEWDDFSPAGRAAMVAFYQEERAKLGGLPAADDHWAQLAVRIFDEYLDLELEPLAHGDHQRDMGHLTGFVPTLRDSFDLLDRTTAQGWSDITSRLASIGRPIAGWRACQEEGMAAGLWATRRQVESTIKQLRAAIAPEGALTLLVTGFADAELDADGSVDRQAMGDALSDALAAAAEAIEEAAGWLESEYLPNAVEADGVGKERYQRHARSFLGTVLDLDDTYRWGWDHLGEIRAEMESIARELDPSTDLAGVVAAMDTDPDTLASSPEEFRRLMLERERQAMRDLEGVHFEIPEQIRAIDVKLAPKGNALGAYFMPPSEDFSRPGTTWWSLGEQTEVPLWSEITTAYHEGFPGHHLQCGIQTCLGDRLSRVHRLLFWLPGYGEGWALYAERLMRELGYLDRPEFVLGLLASNALRAVRVVIDIGCHLDLPIPDDVPFHPGERWSYALGVEALRHYGFITEPVAESEVTRYLGWPGQAIAYKVGERAILALREEVRARDGAAFDLKAFHERVLGSGPVGLDHLRTIVLGAD